MKKTKLVITLIVLCLFTISFGINTYAEIINNRQIVSVGGEETTTDNVTVSKIIEESNIENYFDITLKVQSTERIDEIIKDQDLAIVIVMDISHTMKEGKVGNISRYEAAITAANSLIDDFVSYSKGVNASRKLGYVVFNTDSHDIFSLQDCKDENIANTLKNEMSTKTSSIINASDYKTSHTRFTNIEAGLKRAKNMLDESNIKNKYIILLTDGFPTTYISNDYNGYDPYMSLKTALPTESSNGNFYNEIYNLPCKHGTDYSDRAAIKARDLAITIKNSGINIFSVGTGLDSQKTISYYMDLDSKRVNNTGDLKFATVDTETLNYEIGSTIQDYKDWLKNSIGSNFYYDTNNLDELKNAYAQIFDKVKELSKEKAEVTWVAEDPMGASGSVKTIEFIGLYDDNNVLHESLDSSKEGQSNTANFASNKISWDLKKSGYTSREEGNVTYYIYEVKYRVRLQNELNEFDITKIYDTNGLTRLTYVTRVDGVISEDKYVDFPIPSVKGYLGNFEFIKKSLVDGSTLSGVQFTLLHDTENCPCHNERKYPTINNFVSTSDENGKVLFERIPSGHRYILTETEPPFDYIAISPMDVIVHFGNTGISTELVSSDKIDNSIELPNGYTSIPSEYDLINEIKKTNLLIKKKVKGNVKENRSFEFKLDIFFNDTKLTGKYTYKINNGEDKTINLSEDVIKLKNNDEIVIYNLPVGSTYKIQEVNVEGYHTEYQVNNGDIKVGKLATCDSNNSCRLESSDNSVVFTNYAEFILPKTGSSTTLIMIIIGTLLLVGPVIYILYLFYKDRFVS